MRTSPDAFVWVSSGRLIDGIYVRQVIEQALSDSKAGRTTDVQEVRRRYGLPE
jgi:hypothetical protein